MSNFDKAIKIILSEPPEPHYPAYYVDLLREADVPDKDDGKCSEIPNSSDTISRHAAEDKLKRLVNEFEAIMADIREREEDDSVCGLCEYDGAYIGQSGDWCNECPGFEKDDCFKLSDECRKRWIDTITNSLPSAQPVIRTQMSSANCISRQDAIDMCRKPHMRNADCSDFEMEIMMLPPAEPEPKWIPVSERLPDEKDAGILKKLGTNKRSDYVIATVEVKGERMAVTACTYDGVWHWDKKYAFPDFKVVAWMPMPKSYEGRQND